MLGSQLQNHVTVLLQPDSAIQRKHEEVPAGNATCKVQNMNRDLDGLDQKHGKTNRRHAQCCISIILLHNTDDQYRMKLCYIDLDCDQHRARGIVVMSQPRFKPENVVIVPERVSKKRKVEDIGPRIHVLTAGLPWTEMRYTWQVL